MLIRRLALLLFLVFLSQKLWAAELIQVPVAIQISSKVSDGKYTIPQILDICRDQGFRAVVITDRDLMRWEYGIWPLRNILKKTVEDGSIIKYGAERYIRELKKIQQDNLDLVIIPGVESAPFYYWSGDIFHSNLEIRDWHKHIISIGLKDAQGIRYLPVMGNKPGLALALGWKNLLLFWPVFFLSAGIFFLGKRVCDYKDESGSQLAPCSKGARNLGLLLIGTACVFLVNNFPFRFYSFDQYHGEAGIQPYQNYIDYVNRHSGLSFWSHPEARNEEKAGAVGIRTEEHSLDLLQARDYTGFAVFFEGFKTVGKINGIWDSLLKDFCAGKRNKPVWAVGALSFDSIGNLEDYLKDLRTVLLVPAFNEEECLKAIKEGRMYTALGRNSSQLILSNFSVAYSSVGTERIMGEQLETREIPRIKIKIDFLNGQGQLFKIKLIRSGELINTFETPAPLNITYLDEKAPAAGNFYYRLEIQGQDVVGVSNPIFVRR
jgi:hypothetical protein